MDILGSLVETMRHLCLGIEHLLSTELPDIDWQCRRSIRGEHFDHMYSAADFIINLEVIVNINDILRRW